MKTNCLLFALRIWRYGRKNDHLVIRKSFWGWFPHVAVIFELHDGTLVKREYKPVHPVKQGILPPWMFQGMEVVTTYKRESVEVFIS